MPACRIDVLSARVFVSLLVCFVATTLAVDTIFQQDEDTYWAIADGEQALSIHNTIRVPHTTPSHASPPIDRSFIGFAFEEASFPPYVQTRDGSINQFSLNLIDAIVSRTGGRPIVRLGGTSADFARYVPTQSETALPVAEVYNYQNVGNTTIGPSYWDLTHIIPNSVYIVQLPMANANISESILWAQTAAERIGLEQIQAFEPGNEPDLYFDGGRLSPPEYLGHLTNETYTGNFTRHVKAIKEALSLSEGAWFQAFDSATNLNRGFSRLDVEAVFNLGLNEGDDINAVAWHWYQTNRGHYERLARGLMNHQAISSRLDLFRPYIDFLHKSHPNIPFILSEVGNSLNPTHDYDYQAVLGSALWAVDFQLHAMSIGVARINWQQIMHAGYDMWLPIDSGDMTKQTFANFYAMPFVADFIGKEGDKRVTTLETGVKNVAAYAVFVDDSPTRVAIVNLNAWDQGEGPRSAVSFELRVPTGHESVRVHLLNSPQGAHASAASITYAGSQWTSDSEGRELKDVRHDTKVLKVQDGKVKIAAFDSQALLIHLL